MWLPRQHHHNCFPNLEQVVAEVAKLVVVVTAEVAKLLVVVTAEVAKLLLVVTAEVAKLRRW
jgi:hypothetical protein